MTTNLLDQKCVPCHGGLPPATDAEIATLLPQVPDWTIVEEAGIKRLKREYKFPNFRTALAFTQAVGEAAEEAGHHPVIVTEWGKATVIWWTHAIGGLHQNDFIMAAKTDRAAEQVR